ncbi:efflux transporter periplasmic adaptor subunit [Pseudochryseolinea flava]|uniref:Efflux transporter periplasmic adaptor subunit n=2 Tax=Pseudochryseolinea flava TaxID=2059302 RepID=A0A364XUE8_9BACT|nr:efflux transporter periplasmic adaptor subunit [Pseudochryseolinea flava]
MTRNYFQYIAVALMLLGFMLSCSTNHEQPSTEEHEEHDESVVELSEEQMKNVGVELGTVEQKQISGTIHVNGKLDVPPQQLVSVSAPLGGFLKSTPLLQGSLVKKNQLIASVENLEFIQIQQDFLEAKNQLDLARMDFDRQQQLAKENVNSQKTLQQAQSNYRIWEAKYVALKEKLRVLNIAVGDVENGIIKSAINLYSPINGYVTEVNVNIGKYANPTDVLFEIVDTEHLHAELIVFEKDVPKLKIGQKVRFTLANESTERMATIYLIGREIGENRTVQIHCHIDKEDRELLPGMYLSAAVETGGALVPALPNEALLDYQGKKYIFIASPEDVAQKHEHEDDATDEVKHHHEEGQHFAMLEIQVGNTELGYTEVSLPDSLRASRVVVKGAYALLSKMKNSEEGGHVH